MSIWNLMHLLALTSPTAQEIQQPLRSTIGIKIKMHCRKTGFDPSSSIITRISQKFRCEVNKLSSALCRWLPIVVDILQLATRRKNIRTL
jgi:hypothetical protein